MQYMDGVCKNHPNRPLVTVNGIPTCISCNPAPREFPEMTVTAKDPGAAALADLPGIKPVERKAVVAAGRTFPEVVQNILDLFDQLPMPKDLNQFKAAQKAKTILLKVMETPNE